MIFITMITYPTEERFISDNICTSAVNLAESVMQKQL